MIYINKIKKGSVTALKKHQQKRHKEKEINLYGSVYPDQPNNSAHCDKAAIEKIHKQSQHSTEYTDN